MERGLIREGDTRYHTVSNTRKICGSDWFSRKRPYVKKGEFYQVTGIVSQFASAAPWNDGYRVLVRYPTDLVKTEAK